MPSGKVVKMLTTHGITKKDLLRRVDELENKNNIENKDIDNLLIRIIKDKDPSQTI